MRKITPDSFTVYRLDELELPGARERAIEQVSGLLVGNWWDQVDIDDVSQTIVYAFAEALGAPSWDKFGPGDFPGVDGVALEGWDLDRADSVALKGYLIPENAPALPWAPGVTGVRLSVSRGYGEHTLIDVEADENDRDPGMERDLTVVREECRELAETMHEAVEAAIEKAKRAGRSHIDYVGSAQYAVEYIETNEREFLVDGTLYTG